MLGLTYSKFITLLPSIISILVSLLPFLLVCIIINKLKKEKYLMDIRYKAVAVKLKVTNYEVANQKKKLKDLEKSIINLTNKIEKLG